MEIINVYRRSGMWENPKASEELRTIKRNSSSMTIEEDEWLGVKRERANRETNHTIGFQQCK